MHRNHGLDQVTPRVMRIVRNLRRKCASAAEMLDNDDDPCDELATECCHILNGLRLMNCAVLGEKCASAAGVDHPGYFREHPQSIQDIAADLAVMESRGGRAEALFWAIEQMVCRLETEACQMALDKYVLEVYHGEKHPVSEGLRDAGRRVAARVGHAQGFRMDQPRWEHDAGDERFHVSPFHHTSWRDWEARVTGDTDEFSMEVARVDEIGAHLEPPEYTLLVEVSGFATEDEAMCAADAFMQAEFSASVAAGWAKTLQCHVNEVGDFDAILLETPTLRSETVVCGSTLTKSGKPCGNRVSIGAATCAAGHLAP